ncbi:hypothetical protein ABFS82_06G127000 [Erythranthe guttata]|uniref:Cystatin domain-containing protein n=1 Tax=Erythranthe guttata TaxID=4155 RepID=A0A022R5F4_ERYGU|nr:PREDICTED: uncharacterized protein LOC105960412 [Erythranthe guttata]XP_012840036.1 PREDICTED: uncharacterized protein LOC105960412 [Erythranthe guttata]EYU35244.1 hypothetical protein MIMGU_mgv1a013765mg [Erythranthe guttata]EYU35245.1 hypothetical protein MIMGU_mgv1a013765mg [Erythranthe guttata]|eukprot:XP_012840035.1 PREDICTED: uncharacterized protein LOC105960412 [Erythranthe guttata]
MASCGSDVRFSELHDNESEEPKRGMENRKLKMKTILTQVEKLKEETESESESETGKLKLRIIKLLRQVKKLQKEESELVTKTSESRMSKKGIVRLFMFGRPVAKLLYDRDSSGKDDDPILLHDLNVYAQLATNAYNKKNSSKYKLVEVVGASRSLPITYRHTLYLTFTAKCDDDDDASAKTFQTEMLFGIDHIGILSVDIVDASAISHPAA